MYKLIGSILLITGTSLAGIAACNNLKMRIVTLKMLRKVMIMLRGEISYSVSTLPDALGSIAIRIENPLIHEFFANVSHRLNQLDGQTLKEIWYECTEESLTKSRLQQKDIEQFKMLGDNLGYLDKDMHINTINLYLEQLNNDIEISSDEISDTCRVYKCIGMATGVFISIILI